MRKYVWQDARPTRMTMDRRLNQRTRALVDSEKHKRCSAYTHNVSQAGAREPERHANLRRGCRNEGERE